MTNIFRQAKQFLDTKRGDEMTEEELQLINTAIISRETNLVVTIGIGAASTLESKYKYRFVEDPREWGYDEESIKALKFDKKKNKYRIPNPEHSELLNTILKMSSKKAEVDAAESLPGSISVKADVHRASP